MAAHWGAQWANSEGEVCITSLKSITSANTPQSPQKTTTPNHSCTTTNHLNHHYHHTNQNNENKCLESFILELSWPRELSLGSKFNFQSTGEHFRVNFPYFTNYATCPWLSLFCPWLSLVCPWLSWVCPCLSRVISRMSLIHLVSNFISNILTDTINKISQGQ